MEVLEYADFATAGEPSWLHDPQVLIAVQIRLRVGLSQAFNEPVASLKDPLTQVGLLLGCWQILVLFELGEAVCGLHEPLFLLDVLEVGLRDILGVPQQEGALLNQDSTSCAPVRALPLLLVNLFIGRLHSLAQDVAADK